VNCPAETCHTLSKISSNPKNYTTESTTTFILQPGNHSLDAPLSISNILEFQMVSNETSIASIHCELLARIEIFNASTALISRLKFVGCGDSSISCVDNLTIWNSTFERVGQGSTALLLHQLEMVTLRQTYFLFNTPGNMRLIMDSINTEPGQLVKFDPLLRVVRGGAIHVSSSLIVVEDSWFEGNGAEHGGAIFAESNSKIAIRNCTFYRNWGASISLHGGTETSGGGAISSNQSQIDISNSIFEENTFLMCSGGNYSCNGGALFAHESEIYISGSDFTNNTVPCTLTSDRHGKGGVIYASQSSLNISGDCTFSLNGARTAGVMHLEGSNASMHQCHFNSNTGYDQAGVASIRADSEVHIVNCSFTSNSARTLGGALHIMTSRVTIEQSDFINNSVNEVGAVMAVLEQGYVILSYTTLSKNRATLSVMSVYNSRIDFSGLAMFENNIGSLLSFNSTMLFAAETIFSNCTTAEIILKDTSIQEGGAISAYESHLTFLTNTLFVHNRAKYGGALFAVESVITFNLMVQSDQLLPTFRRPAAEVIISNNTGTITGGGVYLYHSTLICKQGHCFVTGNNGAGKGGGIHAINSNIQLKPPNSDSNHSLVMEGNKAQLGGGVYLEGASKLVVYLSSSTITFRGNTAEHGAAIYVDDATKFDTCFTTPANITPSSECFFNVMDFSAVTANTKAVESFIIEHNDATYNGSSLFGGLLDRCTPHTLTAGISNTLLTGTIVEENIDGLSYLQKVSDIKNVKSIASLPTRVCFCIEDEINCDIRTRSDLEPVNKGEPFTVEIAAVDQIKFPVYSRIFSSLSSADSNLDTGRRFRIEPSCTNITYSIRSPYEFEQVRLYADGPCRDADPSTLTINVTFLPCTCPLGFEHIVRGNDTDCVCDCNSLISDHIQECDVTTESFVRKDSSWISYVFQNNKSTYIVCERCPFRYCRRPSSENDSIVINLNSDIGADAQCSPGHTGTICGICAPNYGVSLAHKRCLPCSEYWYLILIAVAILTILAGLGLVIGILAINFTVAVGTINGFIFYANIVDVYDSIFLPISTSSFPVLIIEWLNLDPGIDVCFIKGIDLYWHTWLRLVFPAYIIFIVIVIILISDRSLRFSKLIAKKNPIATLATLVFLSFTNVLETTVVSLRPTILTYITSDGSYNETVWLPDGDIKYFKDKHIPLFLVALLLVIVTGVYMVLITTWQWVVRLPNFRLLKWTKNQKLKSFMEAYSAPYSDKHRYWTGLLLIVRVFLILISITTEGKGPTIPLASIIFLLGVLFVLKMTYAKNLYKEWPIDVLETAMIFNLYVYAVYTWFAFNDLQARKILAHVSTIITFIVLLVVLAYHIYTYILVNAFPKLQGRMSRISFSMSESRPPTNSLTNLDNRHEMDECDDRFHQMLGTVSMRRQHSVRSDLLRPHVGHSPTFSVLETPYVRTPPDQERETSTSDIQSSSELSTYI
jgi:predicted outer membrane repeat protein